MIKLTFYTTEKKVVVDFDNFDKETYENTPTVQVRDGYYEVMKRNDNGVISAVKPILRVPISQTIMYIND
jgi:hypothetical protein